MKNLITSIFISILFISPILAVNGFAQFRSFEVSPEEQRQLLKSYIAIGLQNNAGIQASKTEVESMELQSGQFGSLPNPMLEFEYGVWSRMTPADRLRLSVMQPIPWFGSLTATRQYFDQLASAQKNQITEKENQLIFDIRMLWYEMHELIHHIYVFYESIELLEQLELQLLSRLETGQGSQVDVLRIQMEKESLSSRIESSEDELESLTMQFNALLNRDLNAPIDLLYEVDPEPVPEVLNKSGRLVENPQLKLLEETDRAAQTDIRRAQLEGRPTLEVGMGIMNKDLLVGDPTRINTVEVMVRVGLPVYRNQYRAREQRARLESRIISETRSDIEISMEADLETTARTLRTAQRDQELYLEKLLPMAEQALEIALTNYSFTGGGFEQIIQLKRQIIDYWMMYYSAISDHNNAVTRIEYLTGQSFYKETEI